MTSKNAGMTNTKTGMTSKEMGTNRNTGMINTKK
jgi:hypothetical protein